MNLIEKLEKYFNTGSTDKQNKRRLGGLLIAITAIVLALSMILLAGASAVALVLGIVDMFKKPDENVDNTVNTDLVDLPYAVDGEQRLAAAGTVLLDDRTIENLAYTKFGDANARPNKENGTPIYKATLAQGLQAEALSAFNSMITEFHAQTTSDTIIWVNKAYEPGATGYYANGLAVSLGYEHYANEGDTDTTVSSIENVTEFDWLYKNSYRFGFIQASEAEGEKNIFRYVGLAHAKYIRDKQTKSKNDDYGLDDYIAELKLTTPDAKKTTKGVKAIGEKANATINYNMYYLTVAEGQETIKFPDETKYNYSIITTDDGGYIVTYWKTANKK